MLFKGPFLHKVWDLVVFLCPIGQYWFGWFTIFYAFFVGSSNIAGAFGCPFPRLSFSECFLIFQKKKKLCISCFSKALFTCDEHLICSLWHHQTFSWKVENGYSVRTSRRRRRKWFGRVLCEGEPCGVCLQCSEGVTTDPSVHQEAWFLQCSPTSSVCQVYLYSHHVLFDCYQLAESTFSTCAIQRYFSTSVYSFWGFWCTFFMICVILFWW